MKEGVVNRQSDRSNWTEGSNNRKCKGLPQGRALPRAFGKQSMVGIVRPPVLQSDKWIDAGNRVPCCAKNPTFEQLGKDRCCWRGKNMAKSVDHNVPKSYKIESVHAGPRDFVVGSTDHGKVGFFCKSN